MTPNNTPKLIIDGPAFSASGLVHRVQKPDAAGPHKTIVMLHGRSGTEDVMWIFAPATPPGWLLVAPRGIKTDPAGGFDWRPRERTEWPALASFDAAVAAVVRFIQALPRLYNADPAHMYLMGFSQGAATAYAVALRHPELIKGIAGLVGFIPTHCDEALNQSPLVDLPIFMAVGKQDQTIPVTQSAGCAQTLTMAGANLEYHEYDTGHKLNAAGMRDLKAWWMEQA